MYLYILRILVLIFAQSIALDLAYAQSETYELKSLINIAREADKSSIRVDNLIKINQIIMTNFSIIPDDEILIGISYFLGDQNSAVRAAAAGALSAFGPKALSIIKNLKKAFLTAKRYECTLLFTTGISDTLNIENAVKTISGENLGKFNCPPQRSPGCAIKVKFNWGALLPYQSEIYPVMALPWRSDFIDDVHSFWILKQSKDIDIANLNVTLDPKA